MIDESESKNLTRVSVSKDCSVGAAQCLPGEQLDVDDNTAIELVLIGHAELSKVQHQAPTCVAQAITTKLLDETHLGVMTLQPKAIQLFEAEILASGVRRNVVAGRALKWIEGQSRLRDYVLDRLPIDSDMYSSIVRQFTGCLETRLARSQTIQLTTKLREEDAEARGLLRRSKRPRVIRFLQTGNSPGASPRLFEYSEIGKDWLAFMHARDRFENLVDELIHEALCDGKIFGVLSEEGRATLRAPWCWNESRSFFSKEGRWHFLSSDALPPSWMPKGKQLRGEQRRKMVEKITSDFEQRYLREFTDEKKPLKAQLISEYMAKYDVSKNLVKEAWGLAKTANWSRGGRRKST